MKDSVIAYLAEMMGESVAFVAAEAEKPGPIRNAFLLMLGRSPLPG